MARPCIRVVTVCVCVCVWVTHPCWSLNLNSHQLLPGFASCFLHIFFLLKRMKEDDALFSEVHSHSSHWQWLNRAQVSEGVLLMSCRKWWSSVGRLLNASPPYAAFTPLVWPEVSVFFDKNQLSLQIRPVMSQKLSNHLFWDTQMLCYLPTTLMLIVKSHSQGWLSTQSMSFWQPGNVTQLSPEWPCLPLTLYNHRQCWRHTLK